MQYEVVIRQKIELTPDDTFYSSVPDNDQDDALRDVSFYVSEYAMATSELEGVVLLDTNLLDKWRVAFHTSSDIAYPEVKWKLFASRASNRVEES